MSGQLELALAAVAAAVRQIPPGRVASYGQVAEMLEFRATARQVGRYMHLLEEDAPWWRVVGADGRLPIGRRDPWLESEQAARLREEGVPVLDGRVPQRSFLDR